MAQTAAHLLTRQTARASDVVPISVSVWPDMQLAKGRVHELCGPTRRRLALYVAHVMDGPVFWVMPAWQPDHLCAQGIIPFLNPGRITFVRPHNAIDLLWCLEEVLRTGAVPLVVGDLPAPPALTPVRRLQLAAETGASRAVAPLGLLLSPGDGGAAGVETRWHMTPEHPADLPPPLDPCEDRNISGLDALLSDPLLDPTYAPQALTRLRARALPPRTWRLRRHEDQITLSPRNPKTPQPN